MQDLALAEGALPKHLHTSMFTQSSDNRMLTNRQLSRHLVGLWVTGHPTAMGLLRRLVVSIDCCWGAGGGADKSYLSYTDEWVWMQDKLKSNTD